MHLYKYYEYIQELEARSRKAYDLKETDILYKNWINYSFLSVYAKPVNDKELDVYFILTNSKDITEPIILKSYLEGEYYSFVDLSSLPPILLNRMNNHGAKGGFSKYYLHRVLVSISVNIKDLQIHHIDRNTRNDRIDNLLPVTPEEHDLIHELEQDKDTIDFSKNISEAGKITTYTKNLIVSKILNGKLSAEVASEITGKTIKDINNWKTEYRRYGRVAPRKARTARKHGVLPDFYILKMLHCYYHDNMSIEEVQQFLTDNRLLSPDDKTPLSLTTIEKYIYGHPLFNDWLKSLETAKR